MLVGTLKIAKGGQSFKVSMLQLRIANKIQEPGQGTYQSKLVTSLGKKTYFFKKI